MGLGPEYRFYGQPRTGKFLNHLGGIGTTTFAGLFGAVDMFLNHLGGIGTTKKHAISKASWTVSKPLGWDWDRRISYALASGHQRVSKPLGWDWDEPVPVPDCR